MNEQVLDESNGLHVCHAVISLDVGGLERVVLDLARDGLDRGRRVSVLCLERPGTLAATAEKLGVNVACADKPPGFRPGRIPGLVRLLRRLRPDVLHSHQIGALFYAGPAARRAGIPLTVHTEHGKHYAGDWRRRVIGRIAGRYAARFFTVSEDILREIRTYGIVKRAKTALVPNGINVDRFASAPDRLHARELLDIPADAFVVGTVGRLAGVKRQDVLLHGFARFAAFHQHARLLIVGEGPLRSQLQGLAADLGVADRVIFAGYADRPENYLAAMDVFALTSESEGMPLAVLEAWAVGRPVVASRVGGLPELIVEGVYGLLFRSGDGENLARELQRLADNAALARSLANAGHRLVRERFNMRVMARAYERNYRKLLGACVGPERDR
jgi:glycosyltransferase involved in cell wall biosynthesis